GEDGAAARPRGRRATPGRTLAGLVHRLRNQDRDPARSVVPVRHLSRSRRGGLAAETLALGKQQAGKRRRPLPNLDAGPQQKAWNQAFSLLELGRRSGVVELLLDRGGLVLADVLLDRLRRAVDQVLRLLEAETGDLTD